MGVAVPAGGPALSVARRRKADNRFRVVPDLPLSAVRQSGCVCRSIALRQSTSRGMSLESLRLGCSSYSKFDRRYSGCVTPSSRMTSNVRFSRGASANSSATPRCASNSSQPHSSPGRTCGAETRSAGVRVSRRTLAMDHVVLAVEESFADDVLDVVKGPKSGPASL